MNWKDAYLDNRVLTANPLELIRMLYDAGIEAVQRARKELAAKDVRARSQAISRALGVLGELEAALDHSTGGEISRNLAGLYQYIRQRLVEANLRQIDQPLAEAESLLETLAEGWKKIQPEAGATAAEPEPAAFAGAEAWGGGASAEAHAWSA